MICFGRSDTFIKHSTKIITFVSVITTCMKTHKFLFFFVLGISGVVTYSAAWRSKKSEPAAQIDLLIDRNDGIINLCEMKYSDEEFIIDKKLDENLRNKKSAFIREAKVRKAVHITMVTTYGVKRNEYWGNIQSEVKMDDLFWKK